MILTEYDEEFVHKGWFQDGLEKGKEYERDKVMNALGLSKEEYEKMLSGELKFTLHEESAEYKK